MLSAKQYLCPRCVKEKKSINRLTKHLNTCIKEVSQTAHLHKLYDDPIDISDGDLENGSQLLEEISYTVRDETDSPTNKTSWDGLLTSESLFLLREE